ncbi:MAG TPA: PAS domain-containing protein, partial [Burkholderiales bacterium]|nr:PAS domain-containing protein [Burkholderiales bacterium]
DALCRTVEENLSGCLCGISLVDATGTRLGNGAAPSLPRAYLEAIEDKPMERDAGPCCTAAVLGEQVISTDVAKETRWVEPGWCKLALSHGLHAIWSTPIMSSAKQALGTFALYFTQPSSPTPEHLAIIERFSHVAAVAIERSHAEEALRLSERRYALALQVADEGHFDWNVQSDEIFSSAQALRVLGVPEDIEYRTRADIMAHVRLHADDRPRIAAEWREALASSGAEHEFEYRIWRGDQSCWIRTRWTVFRDAAGTAQRVVGVAADVTERKRAEGLLSGEKRILEAVARGEPLGQVLDGLCRLVEDLAPGALASILLLEGNRVRHGAAPSLPKAYTDLIDGAAIGPSAGSCGTAAYRGQQVIVSDIATDALWADYRALALPHGLRACWSTPVFSPEGKVIATFAMYYREPRSPEPRDQQVIEQIGHLAGVAIQHKLAAERLAQSEKELRLSEERYALAMEASEEGHFDWNVRSDEVFASARMKQVLGLPADREFRTRNDMMAEVRYHPGDRERLVAMTRQVLASSALQNEFEYGILRGGEVHWLRASWKIFRDAAGAALRVIGVLTDVTERKLAEDELRESEARFRVLSELSSDWYWEQDANLRFTFLSGQVGQLTGYPGDSSLGKTRWEIENMTPLGSSWAEHQAVLAARKPFRDLECRRVGPDGTVRYLSMSGAPLFDAQGVFLGYQGIGRNITERKRIEEELRSRQEMLQLALKSARAVPWQWINGADPQVNRWSPELAAMFGVQPDAFDGTAAGWWRFCHADDLPRIKASIARTLATGEIDVEYRVVHPDGRVHWLNQKGRAFFDANGKPVRSIGFMFEVTERRKVEDDLRSRQEMLELAQKSARAIAFEWKIGATGEGENRWSADLEAMYGFAPGTYDGTFETWKKLVHPDDWPRVREAVKHAQRTGDVASEYRVVHRDGSVHWLQARGRMFFGAAGEPVRMVGFMQDVTQRKQAEHDLRQLEQKLRRAQRLEAMGTLAGGIAHDFNNILGAIVGYGEMALRDAKKGTRLRRDLDAIMAAGERGRSLVDRILAFSRSGV